MSKEINSKDKEINSKDKKFKFSKEKIIIGVLLISLVASVAFGYVLYNNKSGNEPISEYENAVNAITEIDYSKRQEELDQIVEDGMMNVQYSMYASFNGKVSESFNVKNIKNNKHPMVFKIFDENGELIYTSKRIELGYEINSIELDKSLSKGTHECTIQLGYDVEGNVTSAFPIMIEVK